MDILIRDHGIQRMPLTRRYKDDVAKTKRLGQVGVRARLRSDQTVIAGPQAYSSQAVIDDENCSDELKNGATEPVPALTPYSSPPRRRRSLSRGERACSAGASCDRRSRVSNSILAPD